MKRDCRALGAEDLMPGARFCKACWRYKTKKNECPDFVFGGATLVERVTRQSGKSVWSVKRESK